MGRTLLLTGRSGKGKITRMDTADIIKTIAEAMGDRAGGFYTEEILGPGGRKGFRLVTLDGKSALVAHVDLKGQGRPRVSRYGVDVRVIDLVGVTALRRAMQNRQIVVIDEIDKMELFCGSFKDVVLQAVGGPCTVVATVMTDPNPWIDALKAQPGVEVWEVTAKNRDGMAEKVIQWLAR